MLNFLFLFLTGMAVYNVFIVCTIGVPLAIYSDKQAYEFSFYVITISIFFCTTLTLCLVFVPKVCIKYLFGFLCLFWMLLYQGLLIHIVRITRSIYQHYDRIYSTRHGWGNKKKYMYIYIVPKFALYTIIKFEES